VKVDQIILSIQLDVSDIKKYIKKSVVQRKSLLKI